MRDEGQVSAPHPSLVPGFMPDENAIGHGQSNYQIAGKTRQTIYIINIGISGLYERNFKPFLCAREVIISKTKHILAIRVIVRGFLCIVRGFLRHLSKKFYVHVLAQCAVHCKQYM